MVFQEARLFNRTICENIAMGDPEASFDEIRAAAEAAGADEFITRRPDGYASAVGDRGQGLSGGERQRIAIARALLKDSPILILDEATAALDVATEPKLQNSLDRLRAGRTTFVIAHRLSTIRTADRVIVLDRGRGGEEGSFEDLARRTGISVASFAMRESLSAGPPDPSYRSWPRTSDNSMSRPPGSVACGSGAYRAMLEVDTGAPDARTCDVRTVRRHPRQRRRVSRRPDTREPVGA